MNHLSLISLVLLLLTSACTAYIPFTNKLAHDSHLADSDIKNLQFYVSSTFELQRQSSETKMSVTPGGELKYVRGEVLEIVRVKRHTPGVALRHNPANVGMFSSLEVSFVPGDDKNTFPFEIDPTAPNASELKFEILTPIVLYDGKNWLLKKRPYLLIKEKDLHKLQKRLQVLPGRSQ